MTKLKEYQIAERLGRAKSNSWGIGDEGCSHLWLCQGIAHDLGLKGSRGYVFSKKCGYNFNITL